jgi:NNP family nitrate/nitrite transporter-like MFS transporter
LYGVSKVEAADIAAASVFLGSFARPIGGALADRIGGVRLLMGALLVVAVLATAMSQVPPLAVGTGLLLATLATLGLGNGAVFQLLPQRFPRQLGSMTGLVGAAGGVGGFCLPLLLSALSEASDARGAGLLVFGQLALLGLILLAVWQRGWRKTWLRESEAVVINARTTEPVLVPVED